MSESPELYRVTTLDYWTFIKLSSETTYRYWNRYITHYYHNYSVPLSFLSDIRQHVHIRPVDYLLVLFLALFYTIIRINLSRKIVLPLCDWLKIPAQERDKVPESVWKLLYYSCSWTLSVYVVLWSGRYCYFNDPLCIWDNWYPTVDVPWDIYLMYVIQCSFYVHSLYGTVFLDVWRKDSFVMILHHFLTLALIGFSYGARHHAVGALVLLLHDISDVILEFTKLNVYLKKRGGQYHRINDWLATIGFLAFASSWYVFRLYLYPLKVLYTGLYGAFHLAPMHVPFIPMFNAMLWLLLGMNAYWFHFILVFLYKVASGQLNEVDDTREYEVEEKIRQRTKSEAEAANAHQNGDIHQNGYVPSSHRQQEGAVRTEAENSGDGGHSSNGYVNNGVPDKDHTHASSRGKKDN